MDQSDKQTSPLQSVTVSLHPGGSCSLDGDFASPQPLNSSYIRLQNCWTINFSKAQRGFVGARTLHTPWQESINQSRNHTMKRRSADTLNLMAQTGANHREKKEKNPDILSIPQCSARLCSSLRQIEVGIRGRQTDLTAWQALLSALLWASSGVDYHTHRHLFVERVNRPGSVGFPYQRLIDEQAERWLSLSSEANGNWNINLLKGLAADTLDCANLLWVSLTGQSVRMSLCVYVRVYACETLSNCRSKLSLYSQITVPNLSLDHNS